MPVTFAIAPHDAKPVHTRTDARFTQASDWLPHSHRQVCEEVLQSSFGAKDAPVTTTTESLLYSGGNGLVHTALRAYNGHHALIIRPDDVWLAIVAQFSFFVNAPENSERLRGRFVAHEGKKKLVVTASGTRYSVDFGNMAQQMTQRLAENVVDTSLRSWILPNFSTTTDNDRVVGSVLMMATLKSYFSYAMDCWCGIPRLTLEGEKSDWEEIAQRIEKIREYGDECVLWYRLLKPVVTRFVATFDDPSLSSDDLRSFWGCMVQETHFGSGSSYVTGWMTAFCAFTDKGKFRSGFDAEDKVVLDGVLYPACDRSLIPPTYEEVDVELNDNGQKFDAVMVAGVKDARLLSSRDSTLSVDGLNDTLAPQVAWLMYVKKPVEENEASHIN
ncbi:hypothetical protein EXIGLDRAFT_734597 [Exidia glandulosa HHB12029]|uniref:DUF4419 domain-containing protein n=1 Tax=Exidia glandulosa HHB12029 TaxID=1314781 RepID=A0A165PPG7_EXIGL|nr:hypothetical protein EXIGLDRAFT_734597 [Exidia glandulosa HHB12029]